MKLRNVLRRLEGNTLTRKITVRLLLIEILLLLVMLVFSVFLIFPRIQERAVNNTAEMMDSLTQQIDSTLSAYTSYSQAVMYAGQLRQLLVNYNTDPTDQNYNLVALELSSTKNISSAIRTVLLQSEDNNLFINPMNIVEGDLEQLDVQWYQDILSGVKTASFSSIYSAQLKVEKDALAYTRAYNIGTHRYVLTLILNCPDLITIIDTSETYLDGLTITNLSGSSIYELGDLPDAAQQSLISGYTKTADGYYFADTTITTGWVVVGYVSNATLMADYYTILQTTLISYFFLLLFTLLATMPTMNRLVRPIRQLSESVSRISQGEADVNVIIDGDDEISLLSRSFDDMLKSLNTQIERQIAFESNEYKMRYNLLLSQIDSHFIGNTMSAVNSLARQGRTDEIVALNTALLKIIQNNLRIRDLDITDTVTQEMEIVEQYWLITKIRQENQVVLQWDVPDTLLEACIPKNIIQPLVENCLMHGLADAATGIISGTITVQISETESAIRICVQDNGSGIHPELLAVLQDSEYCVDYLRERGRHIGLSNIRQRLLYLYKKDCMNITCDHGTTVIIDIPKSI